MSVIPKPTCKAFINSLPKAGTHLVAKLLDLAGMRDCGFNVDRQMLIRRNWCVNYIHNLSRRNGREVLVGIDMPLSLPTQLVEQQLATVEPGEYVKAHTGYTSAILRLTRQHGLKPVVVIRHPRDVIISLVHFVMDNRKHPLHEAFSRLPDHGARVDAAIEGGFFDGTFLENIRARCHSLDVWLDAREVLVVRFEDLIGSKGQGSDEAQLTTVRALLEYVEITKSAEELVTIASALHGPGRVTFRKGVIGESRKEMTDEQLSRIDEMLAETYQRWKYVPMQ